MRSHAPVAPAAVRRAVDSTITITSVVSFTCPFCDHKKVVRIGYANGDAATDAPVGLHESPHCRQFEAMDLLEYMRAARLAGARTIDLVPG
jgi:hypothetical protein